jgi:hypothetical protein
MIDLEKLIKHWQADTGSPDCQWSYDDGLRLARAVAAASLRWAAQEACKLKTGERTVFANMLLAQADAIERGPKQEGKAHE